MKTNLIKLQICIFALTLISSTVFGQVMNQDSIKQAAVRDSIRISRIKDSLYNASLKKEVASVTTPKGNGVTLTADPTNESIFYRGAFIIGTGIVYQKDLLPVMLMGEYGLGKNIGIELRTWYGSKTTDGIRYQDSLFGLGLNYHFTGNVNNSANASDKFDIYIGGLYGKIIHEQGSAFYAQTGARYFFTKRVGAFANFNLGLIGNRGTNLSFGLAYSIAD
ncbi:MAG: hypothetical protein U5N85_19040 [Arcicella sp.]|nr:hypothetical protein [Arcicella sp.]